MTAPPTTRGIVSIIDDDEAILEALGALLDFEGYTCERFTSAAAFLAGLHKGPEAPRCVLSDVKMPGMDGLQLQSLLGVEKGVPLVLMSGLSGMHEAITAFRGGAVDFLTKPIDDEALLSAIEKAISRSRQWLDHRSQAASTEEIVGRLSPRELDVARLVAKGLTNLGVSLELGITPRTVKFHRQRIMEKLGTAGVPELVRLLEAYDRR